LISEIIKLELEADPELKDEVLDDDREGFLLKFTRGMLLEALIESRIERGLGERKVDVFE
jgi:hypothetical protein